jgi:hypothetical protein
MTNNGVDKIMDTLLALPIMAVVPALQSTLAALLPAPLTAPLFTPVLLPNIAALARRRCAADPIMARTKAAIGVVAAAVCPAIIATGNMWWMTGAVMTCSRPHVAMSGSA